MKIQEKLAKGKNKKKFIEGSRTFPKPVRKKLRAQSGPAHLSHTGRYPRPAPAIGFPEYYYVETSGFARQTLNQSALPGPSWFLSRSLLFLVSFFFSFFFIRHFF